MRRGPLLAGVIAFLIATGAGSSGAYFTATKSLSGQLSTQAVAVTQNGFESMGGFYLPSRLTSTSGFSVRNRSATTDGTVTINIAAPEPLAQKLPITVWPTANVSNCTTAATVPSGALTGTWQSPPVISGVAVAKNSSVSFCVRTTIPDWKNVTHTAGGWVANPVITATLYAGGWTATAMTATHVQTVQGVFPLTVEVFNPTASRWHTFRRTFDGYTYCLDGATNVGAGARVISWLCQNQSNQRWELVPIANGVQSFVTLRPRHEPTLRVSLDSDNVSRLRNANPSDSKQQWYVQEVTGSNPKQYVFVNAATGMCLPIPAEASNRETQAVLCNTPEARITLVREILSFSPGKGTNWKFTFGGSAMINRTRLELNRFGTWVTLALANGGATEIEFGYTTNLGSSLFLPIGDNPMRIMNDANGQVLWDGIIINRPATGTTLTAKAGTG